MNILITVKDLILGYDSHVKPAFLKEVLKKKNLNLLILIKLQRYQKGIARNSSKFSDTFAVVKVNKSLDFEYYEGAVNQTREV